VKVTVSLTLTHNPWGETYWASGLRENLTSRSYGEGLETGRRILQAPRQSLTRQIAIKRWKSVLDVDALRAKACRPLAEVWLHGKLLYALLLERRMRRTLGDRWGRLDQERVETWWRVWEMLKDALTSLITGALFWQAEAWAACLQVLAERPRRRKLQQLPPEAIALLYHRQESTHKELPLAA
jgi:hypothetical protein